jgi:hypothetical protein
MKEVNDLSMISEYSKSAISLLILVFEGTRNSESYTGLWVTSGSMVENNNRKTDNSNLRFIRGNMKSNIATKLNDIFLQPKFCPEFILLNDKE